MHRRDLVKILLDAGFVPVGGTKHERFERGHVVVQVKRHREIREIGEAIAKRILRQAGLR